MPRRHRLVAWSSVAVFALAPFVTSGVRHAHRGAGTSRKAAPAAESKGDPADQAVVVYRRPGGLSGRARSSATPPGIAVAHHSGGVSEWGEPLVHAHDGSLPHVHSSILGIEFSLPVPEPAWDVDETLIALDEPAAPQPSEGDVADEDDRPTGPHVEVPGASSSARRDG